MLAKNKKLCPANYIHLSYASFLSPFPECKLLRMYVYKDAIFVVLSILPLRTGIHIPFVSLIPPVLSSSDAIFAPVRSICLHSTSRKITLLIGYPETHLQFFPPQTTCNVLVFCDGIIYNLYAETHRKKQTGVWVCWNFIWILILSCSVKILSHGGFEACT